MGLPPRPAGAEPGPRLPERYSATVEPWSARRCPGSAEPWAPACDWAPGAGRCGTPRRPRPTGSLQPAPLPRSMWQSADWGAASMQRLAVASASVNCLARSCRAASSYRAWEASEFWGAGAFFLAAAGFFFAAAPATVGAPSRSSPAMSAPSSGRRRDEGRGEDRARGQRAERIGPEGPDYEASAGYMPRLVAGRGLGVRAIRARGLSLLLLVDAQGIPARARGAALGQGRLVGYRGITSTRWA